MDEITQHNAALVERTNAAIAQTEAQAAELDMIVDLFHIDETGSEPELSGPTSGSRKTQSRSGATTLGNVALAHDWDEK